MKIMATATEPSLVLRSLSLAFFLSPTRLQSIANSKVLLSYFSDNSSAQVRHCITLSFHSLSIDFLTESYAKNVVSGV